MAKIPVYDGPQVQQRAVQPVYQGNIDVSSGTRALAGAVGQLGEIVDRRIERDARIEADKADADITAGWLLWDAENRRKFVGERAKDYEPAAQEWWDKTASTYSNSLSPLAKMQLGTGLARKRAAALAAVTTRTGEEIEKHAISVYDAKQNTDIELGIDTGDVAGTAARVRKAAAEFGALRGWTTEQVEAEQQKRMATMHVAYITRMAADRPDKATEYFDANKAEIPMTAQVKIEEVLRGERDNQFAKQFSTKIAGLPFEQQLAKAADIPDPARREKTLASIKADHALVKEAQREREAQASDRAWQLVGQGKRVPEAILQVMDGKARVQLQDYLRDRAKQAASGEAVKTDWSTYIDLRERLFKGENVDLRPFATKLAGGQIEQLLDIKTKVRDPKKQPEVASTEQQMSTYVNRLDLGGEKNAEKRGKFQSAAYDLFNEHLKRNGKEPTYEDRQKILDQLTMEVVTKPGLIWDTKGPAYDLPRVTNDQQWGALKKGDRYIDPTGNVRIKQ